jgi:hypothetical protein
LIGLNNIGRNFGTMGERRCPHCCRFARRPRLDFSARPEVVVSGNHRWCRQSEPTNPGCAAVSLDGLRV